MFKPLGCALILLLASCASSEKKEVPRPLYLNMNQDPSTFDPRKASDFASASLTFFLYDGLMRSTPTERFAPALAQSVKISKDQKTYTFQLKKTYWSNQEPLTAYDFERSWKEVLDPKFPCANAHLLYPIVGAEAAKKGLIPLEQVGVHALNAETLEVTLTQPTPFFLELTAFCTFFPYKEGTNREPLYSGPYLLKSFAPKDHVDFTKNQHYWNASRVKLHNMRFYLIEESNTAVEMFKKGDIDLLVSSFTPISAEATTALKQQYTHVSVPTAGTAFLSFNQMSPVFQNQKLREAFLLAIDRHEIVENLSMMNERVAESLVPHILLPQKENTPFHKMDRAKAKILFEEALQELHLSKEDLKIRFLMSTHHASSNFYHCAQVIQDQIRQTFGIYISIELLETKVYLDHLYKHDYDMAGCFILAQYLDPLAYLDRFISRKHLRNYPAFEDPQYQLLIQTSFAVQHPSKRMQNLEQAEKILLDSASVLPIYHLRNSFFARPNVKNVQTYPQGTLCLEEVEIE